jgi:hypothetical protein
MRRGGEDWDLVFQPGGRDDVCQPWPCGLPNLGATIQRNPAKLHHDVWQDMIGSHPFQSTIYE